MQFPELACSFMSLHAVPFFVWAAHKNFAVLVYFVKECIKECFLIVLLCVLSEVKITLKYPKILWKIFNLNTSVPLFPRSQMSWIGSKNNAWPIHWSQISFWLHVRGFVTVNTIQYDDIFCVFLSITRVCYRQHYSTSTNHTLSKLITDPASSSRLFLSSCRFESGSLLQGSPAKDFSVVSSISRTSDSRGPFFLAP